MPIVTGTELATGPLQLAKTSPALYATSSLCHIFGGETVLPTGSPIVIAYGSSFDAAAVPVHDVSMRSDREPLRCPPLEDDGWGVRLSCPPLSWVFFGLLVPCFRLRNSHACGKSHVRCWKLCCFCFVLGSSRCPREICGCLAYVTKGERHVHAPGTIILPCCCPVRRRVAELVPHFTLHVLRTALYMLSLGR
jgi:hypothetical protein